MSGGAPGGTPLGGRASVQEEFDKPLRDLLAAYRDATQRERLASVASSHFLSMILDIRDHRS
jgi:hypothetical protein